MSEDYLYLIICIFILGITLLFCILRSKKKIQTTLLNIGVAGIYFSYFLYNLKFNSAGGVGLVWFVYLLFSLGLHWLFLVILIIQSFLKRK